MGSRSRQVRQHRESDLMREIQVALSKAGARLFRNNSGMGWAGQTTHDLHGPGSVCIRSARPLHAGLGTGSSDLIGWVTEFTEFGPRAIFLAVEVKTKDGRITVEQSNFIETIKHFGGRAGVARSIEEALLIAFPGKQPLTTD